MIKSPQFQKMSLSAMSKGIAAVGFFSLDVVMARFLGKAGYGEWTFFYAIISLIARVSWFGIDASTKVFVSKGTEEKRQENYRAGLFLRILFSTIFLVVVTAIAFFVAEPIAGAFAVKGYKYLKYLILGAGLLVFFNGFPEFFKSVSIGTQKYLNLFFVTLSEAGGHLVFSLIFVLITKNCLGVMYGFIAAGICTALLGVSLYKKTPGGSRQAKGEILLYALPLLVTGFVDGVFTDGDTFLLGLLSAPAQVSIYGVGKNLTSKMYHLNQTIVVAVMPQFSEIRPGELEHKKRLFKRYALLNCGMSVGIVVFFYLLSEIIIKVLYGNSFLDAVPIMRLLLIYAALRGTACYFALFLEFHKKAAFEGLCFGSSLILNIALQFAMVPGYGALGAASSLVISYIPYTVLMIYGTLRIWKNLSA